MQIDGRERLKTIDTVRAEMRREEERLSRLRPETEIGKRVVDDEPARARARGRLALVPPLPPETPEPNMAEVVELRPRPAEAV